MNKIIIPPKRETKTKLRNFRLTEADAKALDRKLKVNGVKPQHFFEAVVKAYIDGRLA